MINIDNSNKETTKEKVLLLGYGDIAARLSQLLNNNSNNRYELTGVRRSQKEADQVVMLAVDLNNQDDVNAVFTQHFDVIVITMTPDEISDAAYKKAYVDTAHILMNALQKNQSSPRLIIFVSSSGVYGQQNAEWVDESSLAQATRFSGKRLLEAEAVFANSQFSHCVLRFSGIYGPGRFRLIDQVVKGQGGEKTPVTYSNRIHSDDCAGIIQFLIEKQKHETIEPLYLATDCEPVPLFTIKEWLAEQLSLPVDHLKPSSINRQLRSSKRCSNKRIIEAGYQFKYPTYKEGYTAVLTEYKETIR